ncbi:hypothetical protein M0R45_002360 [Rubus argutus]|uniref:Uncharacterized protein n=1 Tax=Rubus argutus TaxID=59490 RepID=A0AAW1VBW1_RUBAR
MASELSRAGQIDATSRSNKLEHGVWGQRARVLWLEVASGDGGLTADNARAQGRGAGGAAWLNWARGLATASIMNPRTVEAWVCGVDIEKVRSTALAAVRTEQNGVIEG